MYIKLIIVHLCMEAQMIAVAVQIMGAYNIDDHNDHGFNKKPCEAFTPRITATKNLKSIMFMVLYLFCKGSKAH